MKDKTIPEKPEENSEDDEEIPSYCNIFIPSPSTGEEDEDNEENNEKKK